MLEYTKIQGILNFPKILWSKTDKENIALHKNSKKLT